MTKLQQAPYVPYDKPAFQVEWIKLFAWCGIAAAAVRLSLILLLGYLQPGYSQFRDYNSELGAPGALHAPVMNYVGITLIGILFTFFSIALYQAFKPGWLIAVSSVLLAIGGTAFIIVGLFPCDQPGCSMVNPSYELRIHMLAALAGLTSQTLAVLTFGLGVFTKRNRNILTVLSLVVGLVAFYALFLFLRAAYLRLIIDVEGVLLSYPGLVQKIIVFSTDIWVFITAAYILSTLQTKLISKARSEDQH